MEAADDALVLGDKIVGRVRGMKTLPRPKEQLEKGHVTSRTVDPSASGHSFDPIAGERSVDDQSLKNA
jgi:hypothetical protein